MVGHTMTAPAERCLLGILRTHGFFMRLEFFISVNIIIKIYFSY